MVGGGVDSGLHDCQLNDREQEVPASEVSVEASESGADLVLRAFGGADVLRVRKGEAVIREGEGAADKGELNGSGKGDMSLFVSIRGEK